MANEFIARKGLIALEDSQVTGSLSVSSSFTASGLNYPSADGTDGQVIMTDGSGILTFNDVSVYAQVKNISGGTLAKGTPVHASGSVGNTSEVIAASASVASTMPATFVLAEQLDNEAEGRAIVVGYINGVNTSGFNEGDIVYVGANGGYTNVKPTGSNLIQNLGIVTKVDASNGSGFVYGAGRSNDVPNITSGYAWVGNSDGVATATPTSSFIPSDVQLTTITGPSDQLLELGNYPVGYDIVSAFAITGSGLIVSASTLASNHYNMVKVGDIELIDLKSIVNPNTFLIHNVDQFSITSGSDGGDIASANYLMTHTGQSFVVHNNGINMLSITNGAAQFTSNTTGISFLTATGNITTRINTEVTNTASLHSFAVYDSDPSSVAGAAIKNIDASKIAYSQIVSGSLVYFGEESGNLSTAGNGLQFSYGNGAVGSIGIPVPVDCYAKKLMFQAETFGTSCTIDLYTGSITTNPVTATGEGMTITGTEHSKVVDINPVFIAAGHYPVFKTAAVSGTYGNVRVGVFLEYPIQI